MKPRNREINIFNISMLDVICGAMGTFLLIMIILLPYYKKENFDYKKEAENLRRTIESYKQQVEEAKREKEKSDQQRREAEKRAERAETELAKTFMVIYVTWQVSYSDIDLFVVDPDGGVFYFRRKTIPNHQGMLSVDNQNGPGNEVWEIHSAPPGTYRVYANWYAQNQEPSASEVSVTGRVIHRDGGNDLKSVTLTEQFKKDREYTIEDTVRMKLMATIKINQEGKVSVE